MSETTEKKRGRETAGDMVRSLGLVLAACVGIWYLAQPPDSDEQAIRVVDPAGDISSFRADSTGTPAPGFLPAQWRPTSTTLVSEPASLRIGYVTPAERYAEYAASEAPRADYLEEVVGTKTERLAPVTVAGVQWEQYEEEDGSLSLVRTYGATTVVLGSKRSTAALSELQTLAQSLTT